LGLKAKGYAQITGPKATFGRGSLASESAGPQDGRQIGKMAPDDSNAMPWDRIYQRGLAQDMMTEQG